MAAESLGALPACIMQLGSRLLRFPESPLGWKADRANCPAPRTAFDSKWSSGR